MFVVSFIDMSHPGCNVQATAVVDRMRRAIAATSDAVSQRLMPISTALGNAFGVEEWYVELFAEEVVRGGPAFAVSLVLSAIEPALRAAAELGSWQLISPGDAVGRVTVVSGLHEVQDKVRHGNKVGQSLWRNLLQERIYTKKSTQCIAGTNLCESCCQHEIACIP